MRPRLGMDRQNISPRLGEGGQIRIGRQAVMAGLGIAFISAHTIASELETRRLAILPVSGLPVMRQWFVVRHANKPVMPACDSLWRFLISQSQRCLPFSDRSLNAR